MRTVFIHIGLPKTGTSYLQSAFAFNYDVYKAKHLVYPDLDLTHEMASNGLITSGNGTRLAAVEIGNQLVGIEPYEIAQFCEDLDPDYSYLISSEWLSGCSENFFHGVINTLSKKYRCKIIAFVRDPADFIVSLYLQGLKAGSTTTSISGSLPELLSETKVFFQLLARLSELGVLRLGNYDKHRSNLLEKFDLMVFGMQVSKRPKLTVVNPSPSRREAEVLRLANLFQISDFDKANTFLAEARNSGSSSERFSISDDARRKIYDHLRGEIEKLNSILPPEERIEQRLDGLTDEADVEILNSHETQFFRELISRYKDSIETAFANDLLRLSDSELINLNDITPCDFDPIRYLLRNPDLFKARVNPWIHYAESGAREGRRFR